MLDRLRTGDADGLSVRLSSLKTNGRLIAAELNLACRPVLHGWLTAYDRDFEAYSTGNLIFQMVLEHMGEAGFTQYDAGPGLSHYKKYLSISARLVGQGVLRSDTGAKDPFRLLGVGWRMIETQAPSGFSKTLAKVRRRSDQILSAETKVLDQLGGFARAALR